MIQNVTSIQVAFVTRVLARFEILDHCIYSSENHTRLPYVPEGFLSARPWAERGPRFTQQG